VSSLWTPSGEHSPGEHSPGENSPSENSPSEHRPGVEPVEAAETQMSREDHDEFLRARSELAAIPVADIIANHAIGLQQLAIIHLIPDPTVEGSPTEPRLAEAGLAIDALGALVDGLGDRLAPHHDALREAVTQLRLAFVEVSSGG